LAWPLAQGEVFRQEPKKALVSRMVDEHMDGPLAG